MHEVEPYYGWEKFYISSADERSPFYGVEYNQFHYDRQVYQYLAHPQWDEIGSDSLLVKVLFADYLTGFAVVELFGVWNDLLINDYRLLLEGCLEPLQLQGISKFAFIMENVLNIYPGSDEYYESFAEELEEGWITMIRAREHVKRELEDHDLASYFFWSEFLDDLAWRKLKPLDLYKRIEARMNMYLP